MAKVSLRAYNREIETMIDRGQMDEAIAHCHHIFKTFPKHLETYRLLGKAYLEYKRFGEAVDIFTRVLVTVPNDFVANVGMSIIRDEDNKLDDAIWHMERAFEVQPSNPAINGELQRLYVRRDGVAPPRIRMTRGALAHMYMRGELYPAAISEIKSVLKEDGGRSDMQSLLARAYYRSGLKNDAAEAASSLLRRYPYCLDANLVLAEILGAERPENAKMYRDRVIELDPYAAQVNGTLFQSSEVPDQAVVLDHLDWNGQPVNAGVQADWRETRAISTGSLGSTRDREEQPDWLKNAAAADSPTVHPQPKAGPVFEPPAVPIQPAEPTPADEIPEFLRAAGWGESTGTFDESKSAFAEEAPASNAGPLAQGDLPDWVKAMAPKEESQQPAGEEELPDWINNIKPGAVAAASTAAMGADDDWLNQLAQPSQPASQPADDQMDWLKGLDSATPSSVGDQPDWLKNLGDESQTSAQPTDQPDWLQGLGSEAQTPSQPAEQTDWLKDLGNEPQSSAQPADQTDWLKELGNEPQTSAQPTDQSDWLQGLGDEAQTPSQPTDQADWLNNLGNEPQTSSQLADQADWLKDLDNEPQTSAQPTDQPDWLRSLDNEPQTPASSTDQPDWLKSLGEETPSAQPSAEPDWLKGLGEETPSAQASAEPDWLQGLGEETPSTAPQAEETDWLNRFDVQPPASEPKLEEADFSFLDEIKPEPPQPISAPAVDQGSLGTSQQEIDDSLAWLENLAAKQGATEGLLTKPEERLEQEPDWIKKVKGSTDSLSEQKAPEMPAAPVEAPAPAPEPMPVEQPVAKVEDLGKSAQEIDDSLAWLEALAAKQGATEGLLTKPEERLEQEPDWVKKVKNATGPLSEQKAPEKPAEPVEVPAPAPEPMPVEQPVAKVEDLGKSAQEIDDSLAWLEALAAKQGATEGLLTKPDERLEQEPDWIKKVKSTTGPLSEKKAPEIPAPVEVPAPTPEPTPIEPPAAKVEDLGKSAQEIDDSLAWLEALAAKQGATEGLLIKPEERLEQEPDWVKQAKAAPQQPPAPPVEHIPSEPVAEGDTAAWLRSLDEEKAQPESTSSADETAMWLRNLDEEKPSVPAQAEPSADETAMWLKSLDEEKPSPVVEPATSADETAMWLRTLDQPESKPEAEPAQVQPAEEDLPAWMQAIEEEKPVAAEPSVPAREADESAQPSPVEEPVAQAETPKVEEDRLPSWLSDLEKEEAPQMSASTPVAQDDLPAWLRDETGEAVAEPTKIEPTRASDWKPAEPKREEVPAPPPPPVEEVKPEPKPKPESKPAKKAPAKTERPVTPVEPYKEPVTRRGTGMLTMPIDPILHTARTELSRSNIPGALETYGKLIKKGRFLDEVIFDLREALYRYPVEVSIWQSLGDAYMRANRLQDALDAYTKAEELLR